MVRGFEKFRANTYTSGWKGVPVCSGNKLSKAGGGRNPTVPLAAPTAHWARRSEEHTSELSHGYISYAVFCLKKKKQRLLRFSRDRRGDLSLHFLVFFRQHSLTENPSVRLALSDDPHLSLRSCFACTHCLRVAL